MNFTIIETAQRSPEWFRARAGRLTGSAAADMLASVKTGEAAARRDLRVRLLAERLTGQPQEDTFVNAAMQWGTDHEADAFAAYEAASGHLVRRTGFLAHTTLLAGCSLDGDVENFAGIVELKCPKTATHLGYLDGGAIPARHLPQLTHNLWISGATWCDFVSYDPRLPADLQLFISRLTRDEAAIRAYETKARAFLAEVERAVEALQTKRSLSRQLTAAIKEVA